MGIIGGPPIGGVGSIPGRGGPALSQTANIIVQKHSAAVAFCHTHVKLCVCVTTQLVFLINQSVNRDHAFACRGNAFLLCLAFHSNEKEIKALRKIRTAFVVFNNRFVLLALWLVLEETEIN